MHPWPGYPHLPTPMGYTPPSFLPYLHTPPPPAAVVPVFFYPMLSPYNFNDGVSDATAKRNPSKELSAALIKTPKFNGANNIEGLFHSFNIWCSHKNLDN